MSNVGHRCPPDHAVLRAAVTADAGRVADILIGARSLFMPYAPSAHSEADVRIWVREQLVPSGGVTVAELGGEVVGVMAVSNDGGNSWIEQMSVHPARVNQGIGAVLLSRALLTLQPPIRLYTFQANTGARRFYERHRFVALRFTDGHANEEACPDVLYEWAPP